MKILSRQFTRAEKLLIVLLIIILLGLVYYNFVDKTVRETITSSEAEAHMLQKELDTAEQKLMQLKKLQDELDTLEAEGRLSYLSSYNNAKAEVAFLDGVLADTLQYSVTFANVTRSGDLIRRSFSLTYKAKDYNAAQVIIQRLCESRDRCIVGDVSCNSAKDSSVSITASATFYETMVGGTPDAGLPSDGAAVNK